MTRKNKNAILELHFENKVGDDMYIFKKDKYTELLDGRTVEWLSKQIGYSATTLYLIFNGHKNIKKALAIAIVKTLNNNYEVDDFFEYIEGE